MPMYSRKYLATQHIPNLLTRIFAGTVLVVILVGGYIAAKLLAIDLNVISKTAFTFVIFSAAMVAVCFLVKPDILDSIDDIGDD